MHSAYSIAASPLAHCLAWIEYCKCGTIAPLSYCMPGKQAFPVTGPHSLPWPGPSRNILLFLSCTDAERLNPCSCWLANVSFGDCQREHHKNKIGLSFRPSSDSEKFRRFQNNLLLAEALNFPTKVALVGHKAINQGMTPFENTGFFHPWISILW